MDLLKRHSEEIVNRDELSQEIIDLCHLTLKQYRIYQLVFILYQYTHEKKYKDYLDLNTVSFSENKDFRNGVNDAFCEIVKAGVKKLALSHATDDPLAFSLDNHSAYLCTQKYGISYYLEESLISTLLFENSGCQVVIFYKDEQDIQDYLSLKKEISSNSSPSLEQLKDYAREFGRLLSYSKERVEEMIEERLQVLGME